MGSQAAPDRGSATSIRSGPSGGGSQARSSPPSLVCRTTLDTDSLAVNRTCSAMGSIGSLSRGSIARRRFRRGLAVVLDRVTNVRFAIVSGLTTSAAYRAATPAHAFLTSSTLDSSRSSVEACSPGEGPQAICAMLEGLDRGCRSNTADAVWSIGSGRLLVWP